MANFLLLITAALWGLAFVAQRKGMESLDAFTFNAIRFALGAIFVRFALYRSFAKRADIIRLPGIVLFVAATFQQIGLIYTSAGSAGFITGLYVIFVPLIGIFRGQRLSRRVLYGILLAVLGLYLINRFESLQMSLGNLLVLISAVFFAWHVQIVDKYSKLYPTGMLAFDQFGVCALLSFIFAGFWRIFMHPFDTISAAYLQNIGIALIPILYGGLISVGIAYTLQIKAQREAEPAPAAVIMCLEGVFAMIGGYLILSENITLRSILGAAMLLIAMLLVSIPKKVIDRKCPVDLSAQT
jgi:drug/metabolite transporter (DMT)-like permease